MPTKPATVEEYLAALPPDRRDAIDALRRVILANLDAPFEEGIQYGMIGYYLPHSVYPQGYHANPEEPLPFASIASQKHHIGLYLFCVYMDDEIESWFRDAWADSGKKLDMGKSCVRAKRIEDIPLDVVGKLFARIKAEDFVEIYEAGRASGAKGRTVPASRKKARRKPARKKAARKASRKGAARSRA